MIDWKKWRHVTKLDPDKPITKKDVALVVDSGTDAIFVSGTLGITKEKVQNLVDMLAEYNIPKVLEPSREEGMRWDLDYVFVPSVFNSKKSHWVVGIHKDFIIKHPMTDERWNKVVTEAYIVLNGRSGVAWYTGAQAKLRPEEVAAYAEIADRMYHFPIVYIEYSGTFGDPNMVKAAKEKLKDSVLYYGGGIDSAEKAQTMAKYADTIVVGNSVYRKGGAELLRETVVK